MIYNSGIYPTNFYNPQYSQSNIPQTPMQSNNNIIWVQGINGAKSYQVAPNTSVQLWDSESQTIYIKSADASGIPSIKIIDYTFRDNAPQNATDFNSSDFATKSDINTLQQELNALKSKLERFSGKSNKSYNKSRLNEKGGEEQ